MAHDEVLAVRIQAILGAQPGYQEKKMFGGVGCLLHGNMACRVIDDDLIVRVGAEKYAQALTRPGARVFDMTGRPMTGWVRVAGEALGTEQALRDWVLQSAQYALSLPPKAK
jgi:TfoX/Sxy family transcriptional regulator of competence genes